MAVSFERSNNNGVSESIGFILIFTIIITGIGLVTLYGYPMLTQQQVSADEKIMEKNMIVLQNDIKSLAYKTVPYKETSLKIGSGSLTVYGSSGSSGTLDIYYPICPTSPCESFDSGELRYESVSAQTDISLQNGAVMMRPRLQPGSSMLAEPRWIYDENPITSRKTMVITLIEITSDDIMAREGIGTVRMKLVGDPVVTRYDSGSNTNQLLIDYIPQPGQDYSTAWRNYFINTLKMDVSGLSFTKNIHELVIKKYVVKIESV